MTAALVQICISDKKGVQKRPVDSAELVVGFGVKGDAHGGPWHRQVSLLADESAQKIRDEGVDIKPGDFGENLLTKGIDLVSLPVGTKLRIGDVLLQVTQIGKECHTRCAIFYAAGTCVMPTEGIFGEVLEGGVLKPGDEIHRL